MIIPTRRKGPFDDPEWLFEFKYNGFRALCNIERGGCRFISRNGNMLGRFDALADQVAAARHRRDGEVIVADGAGRPQFYELLRVPRSASYVAFDILWVDGTDLRSLPLSERRKRLQAILPANSQIISEALFVEGRGRERARTRPGPKEVLMRVRASSLNFDRRTMPSTLPKRSM